MKRLVTIFSFLIMSQSFSSIVNVDEMEGSYQIKPFANASFLTGGMSVEYKVAISKVKDSIGHNVIGLNETFTQKLPDGTVVIIGEIKCEGVASMDNRNLNLSVSCDNDSSFEHTIKLGKDVEPLATEFKAAVYNSFYGKEIAMDFKRLP